MHMYIRMSVLGMLRAKYVSRNMWSFLSVLCVSLCTVYLMLYAKPSSCLVYVRPCVCPRVCASPCVCVSFSYPPETLPTMLHSTPLHSTPLRTPPHPIMQLRLQGTLGIGGPVELWEGSSSRELQERQQLRVCEC